jgi:hypothetical protein
VNREIVSFISELRRKEGGADRFFTENNDGLGTYVRRSTGSHGIVVSLDEHGQKILWLHLKDGLSRSTNVNVRHDTSRNLSQDSQNKSSRNKRNDE